MRGARAGESGPAAKGDPKALHLADTAAKQTREREPPREKPPLCSRAGLRGEGALFQNGEDDNCASLFNKHDCRGKRTNEQNGNRLRDTENELENVTFFGLVFFFC